MSKSWKRRRREAILSPSAWPIHAQLEAISEAMAGNPVKIEKMLTDISAIKLQHPKPEALQKQDASAAEYVGLYSRRADELEAAGQTAEAIALRQRKGIK